MNHIFVSAVTAAVVLIVNDPAAGTTFLIIAVLSLVIITHVIILAVVTSALVTTTELQAAAILTLPVGLSIVCAPTVPHAVIVASCTVLPVLSTPNKVVQDDFLHRMKFLDQDHSLLIVGFRSSIVYHAVLV